MSPADLASSHPPLPPLVISVAFLALVAVLYVALLAWIRRAEAGPRTLAVTRVAVVAWLAITAAMAMSGILTDFQAVPPRFVFAVLPAILAVVVVALHPGTGALIDRGAGGWLIGFQFFRVPLELILWRLAGAGVIPSMMTFEGRNYDILVGITAPIVAWLAYGRRWVSSTPLLLWNLFGLALLANIVTIAILSTPTRFRAFFEGPPVEMVAHFPFVWLPAFVVPMALLGHLVSIRHILRARRRGLEPGETAAG